MTGSTEPLWLGMELSGLFPKLVTDCGVCLLYTAP
jgi:hypothetical protein